MKSRRAWEEDELIVLVAIFFNANFSVGDDARDECRTIADCFGRSAAAIDRQWRNIDAVLKQKVGLNIGKGVYEAARAFTSNPAQYTRLAIKICEDNGWPLVDLIKEGRQASTNKPVAHEPQQGLSDILVRFASGMTFKFFPSGSEGFYREGEVIFDRRIYQLKVSAVAVRSPKEPAGAVCSKISDVADAIRGVAHKVEQTVFGSGRTGFHGMGRILVGKERFQVSVRAEERWRKEP
jgi:hypothetical protein